MAPKNSRPPIRVQPARAAKTKTLLAQTDDKKTSKKKTDELAPLSVDEIIENRQKMLQLALELQQDIDRAMENSRRTSRRLDEVEAKVDRAERNLAEYKREHRID